MGYPSAALTSRSAPAPSPTTGLRPSFCEATPWVKHLRLFVLVVLRQHVALVSAPAPAAHVQRVGRERRGERLRVLLACPQKLVPSTRLPGEALSPGDRESWRAQVPVFVASGLRLYETPWNVSL